MKLLVFSGLSDEKLISKISPILSLEKIEKVYLVRNSSFSFKKVISINPPFFLNILLIREIIKFLFGFYVCLFKKIDYVIGIFLFPHGIFAHVIGKIFKKPIIQLFVGKDVDLITKHRNIFKSLLKNAKYIGVRGNNSKRILNEIIKKEELFFIQRNVYSFLNPPDPEAPRLKDIDIIYVAHFDDYKRIDVFLKVISRIKEKYPYIKAALVGKDVRKGRTFYEKMRKELGLEENIRFPGYVENVYSYLDQSKIFLMTSESEGLPMSMIEAMNAGLPCVVPNVGDISDIAENNYNAFLVEPLDVAGFVSRTIQLLEDKNLCRKMSQNALDTIRKKGEEFSVQYNKKIWDNILG
ncbi:MAG: glycosyltransferase family 4 protein [Candidatus Aminicenantes bacterium]|nr:MAG: glycosyltransferase family 4 protein [Candidatus Aminicenantes bacterium]